jgi:hypothetical protein
MLVFYLANSLFHKLFICAYDCGKITLIIPTLFLSRGINIYISLLNCVNKMVKN